MSADVLFDGDRLWSTRGMTFQELMRRARGHCTSTVAADLLAFADVVQCLAINRYDDDRVKVQLCRALVGAAREWIAELPPGDDVAAKEAESFRRLVELAEEGVARTGQFRGHHT